MTCVIVNDASCLIDLHKGRLLHVLLRLPYRFVIPLPVRESELLSFTEQEWQLLDDAGLETFNLSSELTSRAFVARSQHPRLSPYDCFCLVVTEHHGDSVLLTGDNLLRRVAADRGMDVHGALWIIDELAAGNHCEHELLVSALEAWQTDDAVFMPTDEIAVRLRRLR